MSVVSTKHYINLGGADITTQVLNQRATDAWAKADAQLQPAVIEAHQALKRLGGDANVARAVTPASTPRP